MSAVLVVGGGVAGRTEYTRNPGVTGLITSNTRMHAHHTHIRTRTYTGIYMHACTHMCTHEHTYTGMCTYACTHIHAHIHTCIHSHIYTHALAHIHTLAKIQLAHLCSSN